MEADPADRLRGVLLAGAGALALLVGGWWWRAEAPSGEPLPAGGSAAETYWGDPDTGFWRQDAHADVIVRDHLNPDFSVPDGRTGRVPDVGSDVAGPGAGYRGQEQARQGRWSERATLRPGDALVRQGQLAAGESRVLRFSCTGPGELLIQVAGARAADPLTAGCDGAVAMIEIIGTGAPVQVSFSPAGAAPLEMRAQLLPNG